MNDSKGELNMEALEYLHFLLDLFEYKRMYQADSSGLRPIDLFLLERIHQDNGCQTLELSKKYHYAPATLISMLDRLEAANLIERRRSKEDRRIVQIFIKKKGALIIKNHVSEDRIFASNLLQLLNIEEQDQLLKILEKMRSSIKLETLFLSPEDDEGR
jgi:DNA-binding MarR family transcriptional regulator